MGYNLTPAQKDLLVEIISVVRMGKMDEEFMVVYNLGGADFADVEQYTWDNEPSQGKLDALALAGLIQIDRREYNDNVSLLGAAFEAVDSRFSEPDTSFMKNLTPMADVSRFDKELVKRSLPILGAGAADPAMWDSAVRTAAVVLEERLRDIGKITDPSATGKDIVNKAFTKSGTLASKFTTDSERESYRDLYAGVVGLIRNPSAHRLIDPTPEEGGVSIVLINLLLRKLEAIR